MNIPRTRVKYCGITRVADALAAAALGVDAIGVVLTPQSKRFAGIERAREIRAVLPPFVAMVALFMDDDPHFVAEAVAAIAPHLLQFHGSEAAPDCVRYAVPYLKAVAMGGDSLGDGWRQTIAAHPQAAGFLFDAHTDGGQGGSGRVFDWSRISAAVDKRVILAGGLTPENVGTAVRTVRPYAVDVSSGIESAPGVKDLEKMQRFIDQLRATERG
jgi:phosphoribosylanthranilate isomerase